MILRFLFGFFSHTACFVRDAYDKFIVVWEMWRDKLYFVAAPLGCILWFVPACIVCYNVRYLSCESFTCQ